MYICVCVYIRTHTYTHTYKPTFQKPPGPGKRRTLCESLLKNKKYWTPVLAVSKYKRCIVLTTSCLQVKPHIYMLERKQETSTILEELDVFWQVYFVYSLLCASFYLQTVCDLGYSNFWPFKLALAKIWEICNLHSTKRWRLGAFLKSFLQISNFQF